MTKHLKSSSCLALGFLLLLNFVSGKNFDADPRSNIALVARDGDGASISEQQNEPHYRMPKNAREKFGHVSDQRKRVQRGNAPPVPAPKSPSSRKPVPLPRSKGPDFKSSSYPRVAENEKLGAKNPHLKDQLPSDSTQSLPEMSILDRYPDLKKIVMPNRANRANRVGSSNGREKTASLSSNLQANNSSGGEVPTLDGSMSSRKFKWISSPLFRSKSFDTTDDWILNRKMPGEHSNLNRVNSLPALGRHGGPKGARFELPENHKNKALMAAEFKKYANQLQNGPKSKGSFRKNGKPGRLPLNYFAAANDRYEFGYRFWTDVRIFETESERSPSRSGIDNFFISHVTQDGTVAFGVADGSSKMLEELPYDGVMSNQICFMGKTIFEESGDSKPKPDKLIKEVYQHVIKTDTVKSGMSSVSFGMLTPERKFYLASSGTAITMLFREGKLVKVSKKEKTELYDKTHYLVKSPEESRISDRFHQKQLLYVLSGLKQRSWDVQQNDVLVMATDGLYENLSIDHIKKIVMQSHLFNDTPSELTNLLVSEAVYANSKFKDPLTQVKSGSDVVAIAVRIL